jgi:hypothetical protein
MDRECIDNVNDRFREFVGRVAQEWLDVPRERREVMSIRNFVEKRVNGFSRGEIQMVVDSVELLDRLRLI